MVPPERKGEEQEAAAENAVSEQAKERPETAKKIDRISIAATRLALLLPEKRLLTAAFAMALLEACTPAARSEPKFEAAPELTREDVVAMQALGTSLERITHDAGQSKRALDGLVGTRTLPKKEWHAARERMRVSFSEPLDGSLEKIPIGISGMQDVYASLPDIWKNRDVNDGVTFRTRADFRAAESKGASGAAGDFDKHKWETACSSSYSGIDHTSHVSCNVDLMNEYGFKAALKETFFHEFSHSADPRRLPLPVEKKAAFWNAQVELILAHDGPQSKYVDEWVKSAGEKPDGEMAKTLIEEAWAETMSTVFKTSDMTVDATSWETWKPKYEKALVDRYASTPEGALRTYSLVKAYFDEVDPGFAPWESAKKLKKAGLLE